MSVTLFKIELNNSNLSLGYSIVVPNGYRFVLYKASRSIGTSGGSSSSSSGEPFTAGLWAFGGTGFYEKFNGFWSDDINGKYSKVLEFPHNAQGLPGGVTTPIWEKQCADSESESWYKTRLVAFSTKTYNGGINWMIADSDDEGDLNSDELIEQEIANGGTFTRIIACNTTISANGYEVPYERQEADGPGMPSRVVFNNCSGYEGTPPYFIWLTSPYTEGESQPGDVFGPVYLHLIPNGASDSSENAKRISDYAIYPDEYNEQYGFSPYKEKMTFNAGDRISYVPNAGGFEDNCALIGMLLDGNGVPAPEATVRSLFSGYTLEFTSYSHSN